MTLRTALLAAAGALTFAAGARAAEPPLVVVDQPVAMVAVPPPAPIALIPAPVLAVSQMLAEQQAMMTAMMADMSALRLVALPGMMAPLPAISAAPGQMVVTRMIVDGSDICRQTVVYRAGANGVPVIQAASRSAGCAAVAVPSHPARLRAAPKPDQGNGLTVDSQGDRLYSVVDQAPVAPPRPTKF